MTDNPNGIRTKIFQYGDEKEGSWPSQFGNRDPDGPHHFYIDPEDGKLKPGYPPRRTKEVNAPYVIGDTMPDYYHPKAGCVIDSKSRLRAVDEALGTITTDRKLPPNPSRQNQLREERHKDIHQAMHKSVAQIDAGTAPLTEEVREKCAQENERISNLLGFDAFNVAGKKNDKRGKKYRRR